MDCHMILVIVSDEQVCPEQGGGADADRRQYQGGQSGCVGRIQHVAWTAQVSNIIMVSMFLLHFYAFLMFYNHCYYIIHLYEGE